MGERRNAASLFSHSLKTPLSSVKVAVQLLLKHLSGRLGDKDQQLLEMIHRNAGILEARINRMIDLANVTTDRFDLSLDLEHLEEVHSLKEPASGEQPAPQAPPAPAPAPPETKSEAAGAVAESPGDGKIVVHADPEIADLIPKFLENRQKDIDSIRAALEKMDFDTIRVLGHSMKGAGGGYGFPGVTEIGRHLEDAAKIKDTEVILKGIEDLTNYLNSVEVVYDEL
jgi:signal transduction histidine kinase